MPGRYRYYQGITIDDIAEVIKLGFEPVDISKMPRNTDSENEKYLLAKLQGVEEGTIAISEDQLKALDMELKVAGMYKGTTRTTYNVSVDASIESLLADWKDSRHTLRKNSTVVGLPEIGGPQIEEKILKAKRGD